MKEYTCIIALGIIFCLLIVLCFLYLQFRRTKKRYCRTIIKNIREQDRMAHQLEQARIEKETIEKILETKLTAPDEIHAPRDEIHAPRYEAPVLRIDITAVNPDAQGASSTL